MTSPERPLSRFLRRERLQMLHRRIHRSVPKHTTLLVFLVLVGGALVVASGPALSQPGTPPTSEPAANNSTVAPGAQVASGVSVEGIVLRSDLQQRTLDVKLARAASDKERAAIVARIIQRLNGRLDTLETRYQQLQDGWQAGTISDAAYYVKNAKVVVEATTIQRMLGQLRTAATELPATQFGAQYTNTTTIGQLDKRAGVLTNSEISATSTSTPIPTPTATSTTTDSTDTDEPTATDEGDDPGERNGSEGGDDEDDDVEDDDEDDDSGG